MTGGAESVAAAGQGQTTVQCRAPGVADGVGDRLGDGVGDRLGDGVGDRLGDGVADGLRPRRPGQRGRGRRGTGTGPASSTLVQTRRPTLSASLTIASSSTVRILRSRITNSPSIITDSMSDPWPL